MVGEFQKHEKEEDDIVGEIQRCNVQNLVRLSNVPAMFHFFAKNALRKPAELGRPGQNPFNLF